MCGRRYVLGCGNREVRQLSGSSVTVVKGTGDHNKLDHDLASYRVSVRAPPTGLPACRYRYFHTVKYEDNPFHDVIWQFLYSRVTAELYGVPWAEQRRGPRAGVKSELRTWMEAQNPLPLVEGGVCFSDRFVSGVHPTVVEATRVPGLAPPALVGAYERVMAKLWDRPSARGTRTVFLNRGAGEGRHVLGARGVSGVDEYLELPVSAATAAAKLRDARLLVTPYGSNFVNVGFLAPGSTVIVTMDREVIANQFTVGGQAGSAVAWMAELEALARLFGVDFRLLQYSGVTYEQVMTVTRDWDLRKAYEIKSQQRLDVPALERLISEIVAA